MAYIFFNRKILSLRTDNIKPIGDIADFFGVLIGQSATSQGCAANRARTLWDARPFRWEQRSALKAMFTCLRLMDTYIGTRRNGIEIPMSKSVSQIVQITPSERCDRTIPCIKIKINKS
jgi:hypothetical protein